MCVMAALGGRYRLHSLTSAAVTFSARERILGDPTKARAAVRNRHALVVNINVSSPTRRSLDRFSVAPPMGAAPATLDRRLWVWL